MKFLQIDEDGFPMLNGLRVDREYGSELLRGISSLDDQGRIFCIRKPDEEKIFVEYFDQPYVAQHILKENQHYSIQLPFDIKYKFEPQTLRLDEWDRFHGITENRVPFVMSRKAQASFFDLLEEFDDTSITINGIRIEVPQLFQKTQELEKSNFWDDLYNTHNKMPPWNLSEPHTSLQYILPQLKIPRSRILVLGCGYGHDAAFLARVGHFVTGVDFSPEAIEGAKLKYGDVQNLKFEKHDLFHLPDAYNNSFDLIFEHTCFCAVDVEKRNEVVKIWKNCLTEQGHLLGIFFVHRHYAGVPYGATEWELRERLKSRFQFLYWTRWHGETTRPPTQELMVYAKRR